MSNAARDIIEFAGAKHLKLGLGMPHTNGEPRLDRANLSGRLTEISGSADSALLTTACHLLLAAQDAGETTAWITTEYSCFYPPDLAQMGIDLAALPIIRVPRTADIPRAADKLARSGAFGFIVCDLASEQTLTPSSKQYLPRVPAPLQSRLLGLARKHQITLLFLTHKRESDPSLSSLVSLRSTAERSHCPSHDTKTRVRSSAVASSHGRGRSADKPSADDRQPQSFSHPDFRVTLRVIKDKRHAPGWSEEEVYHGPPGLR